MTNNGNYQPDRKRKHKETQQNVFKEEPHSTKNPTMSGLDENLAGLLSYIVIVGLIFLFIEKENEFVRFHALQAIFTSLSVFAISIILSVIPVLGLITLFMLSPLFFLLFIFLMYQAYNGKRFMLPFVGDLAKKYAVAD